MWGYDSMAERDELRAKLYADPEWIAFGPKTHPPHPDDGKRSS